MSRLNAGLFISRDHKVVRPQGKSVPYPVIEVQNPAGLLLKLKDPEGRSSCGIAMVLRRLLPAIAR
jgi:hypothetical protein